MQKIRASCIGVLITLFCVADAPAKPKENVILTMQGHVLLDQPLLPRYPQEALKQHWKGSGVILLRVRPDGTVSKTEVLKSTGHSILDADAMRSFATWRFRPEKTAFTVNVPCDFRQGKPRTYQERRTLSKEEAAKVMKRYEDNGPTD